MKLERNRAERRSKRGVPILYNGIPYLIFAALAAGFLLGTPQAIATSSIAQAAKSTVTVVERRRFPFAFAGYLGKTNSVITRGFTEDDFTYTGSKTWVDEGDGNWRLKFTSSGTFTLKKKTTIDAWLLGGGAGGGNANGYASGGGGGGGRTAQVNTATLTKGTYIVTIGAGGGTQAAGGITSFVGGEYNWSVLGGTAIAAGSEIKGTSGGSGGGTGDGGYGGSNGGNGGAGSGGAGGIGQGTTTREFGDSSLPMYVGGGGGGGGKDTSAAAPGAGGAGGGANGGARSGGSGYAASANTGGGGGGGGRGKYNYSVGGAGGSGGSGILVIRNAR